MGIGGFVSNWGSEYWRLAVVVWVFAGGGEAEVAGLIPFLEKCFPQCVFKRKTPARQKPGPKANQPNRGSTSGYGRTGDSLIAQINRELAIALRNEPESCQLILVIDDLDCRNYQSQKQKFLAAINLIPNCATIPKFVAFAAPELEAWIIADWDHSIAKYTDFRRRHEQMRWWLSQQCHVPFDAPESFSTYDPSRDSCEEKLSDLLILSTTRIDDSNIEQPPFSKKNHTPELLKMLNPEVIQKKCLIFREFYNYMRYFFR